MPTPRTRLASAWLGLLVLGACAPALRPPTLRLDKVNVEKARLRGLGLDVYFRVRNPNPDPILLEGLDYELVLNGHRLGRGYYPDAVALGGLSEELIISRFELNWLSLPGSVRAVLEEDSARAHVHGTFYVRQGARRAKAIDFDSGAQVSLRGR